MSRPLFNSAARYTAAALSFAFVVLLLLAGWKDALSLLAAGLIAGLDFLAIIWICAQLLEPGAPRGKGQLVLLLLGKLLAVAILLWWAIAMFGASPLGVTAGVGVAILGFTFGLARAYRAELVEKG